MSDTAALGEFLRSRRGRIGPADVGLPVGTGRRQLPGLRREELAALAGVSIDYYIRLEQGRDTHPSASVLDALATALQLDQDGRAHLHQLAASATAPRRELRQPAVVVRAGLLQLLETVRPSPGFVLSATSDLLATNREGLLVLPGIEAWPADERNLIRYVFTCLAARETFVSWTAMAQDCVAHLRTVEADPVYATRLADLVAELSAASREFADLWAHYDVRVKSGAQRRFRHPSVGTFELRSEILAAGDGQRLIVFQAAPGSPDHDAVALLSLVTSTS